MKIVYMNTDIDKEIFTKEVLTPLVGQFPDLSHATITTIHDNATGDIVCHQLQIIDRYGDNAYRITIDNLTIQDIIEKISHFLIAEYYEHGD